MQPSASPPQSASWRGPPPVVANADLPSAAHRLNPEPRSTPSHQPLQVRYIPIETAYARFAESSETPALPPQPPPNQRRQSKLNFRLFNRNRSTRQPGEFAASVPEQEEKGSRQSLEQPQPEPQIPATPSPEPDAPPPLRERHSTMRMRSKRERTARPASSNEPPPLFQAYPQAVKEGHLLTPVTDAETVLRLNRSRQSSEDSDVAVTDANETSPIPETTKDVRRKINKRRASTMAPVCCASKLYLLTTSGWLLQYANEGCHNRLPERIMQLRKDSAAFASDAIPGKHWVLQISQSFSEDGATVDTHKQSVFSKLSFGQDAKKHVSNFLLVMNSAEEMNSWLVTMRKEIQSLGGIEYRPDERTGAGAVPVQRSVVSDTGSTNNEPQSTVLASEQRQRALSQRASMYSLRSPPGSGLPPLSLPGRPELVGRKASTGSTLSHRASMYALSPTHPPQVPALNWQPFSLPGEPKRSPRGATFNLDKALPERPVDDAQARIDTLSIINAEHLRRARVAAQDDVPLSPRSFAHSLSSPKFPVSAYNPEAYKYSAESPRASEDVMRHQQFSWERSLTPTFIPSQAVGRPSHDTTMSGRARTTSSTAPSLTDGESAPQDSLPGDIPARESVYMTTHYESTPTGLVHGSHSPTAIRIEVQQTPTVSKKDSSYSAEGASDWSLQTSQHTSPTGRVPLDVPEYGLSGPQPRRAASFEHTRPDAPPSSFRLQPAPYPVPKSSLPALPLDVSLPPRPSSAQANAQRSISPMPTTKGLRRPSSFQPPTPGKSPSSATGSTLHLPMAKPLTIQERRRLSHRPVIVGPPTLPPPTSPLPQLPQTAGPAVRVAAGIPSTMAPSKVTPPTLATAQFPQPPRRLPDSPRTIAVPPLPSKPTAAVAGAGGRWPRIYQGEDESQAPPATENWNHY